MSAHNLAISETWTLMGPTPIQRMLPFTSLPTPGINTATKRPIAASNSKGPARRQRVIGT